MIFSTIKSNGSGSKRSTDPDFIEKVQVLLIVYFNMGITQIKLDNKKYAKIVLEHGWKMARKLLGEGSYFERKFFAKVNECFGKQKQAKRHLKSTHISYIEEQTDKVMNEKPKIARPSSSYYQLSKIDVEESKHNKRNSKLTEQASKDEKDLGGTKIINKSSKRKIFVDKDASRELNNTQSVHSDVVSRKESASRIDEDRIKEVVDKIKQEAEAESENKFKEFMDKFNKKQEEIEAQLKREREELK